MTQDEMIELAKRAGIKRRTDVFFSEYCDGICFDDLEAFAKLIAEKEREACAEIAEKQRYAMNICLTSHPVQNGTAVGIANQIKARGQA
jgi:predicted amidohydrolase